MTPEKFTTVHAAISQTARRMYASRSVVEPGFSSSLFPFSFFLSFFFSLSLSSCDDLQRRESMEPVPRSAGEYIRPAVADKRRTRPRLANIPITESEAIKSLDRIIRLGFVPINGYKVPRTANGRHPYPSASRGFN